MHEIRSRSLNDQRNCFIIQINGVGVCPCKMDISICIQIIGKGCLIRQYLPCEHKGCRRLDGPDPRSRQRKCGLCAVSEAAVQIKLFTGTDAGPIPPIGRIAVPVLHIICRNKITFNGGGIGQPTLQLFPS